MKLSAARVGWTLAEPGLWFNELGIPIDLSSMSPAMLNWHLRVSLEHHLAQEVADRYADPAALLEVLVPPAEDRGQEQAFGKMDESAIAVSTPQHPAMAGGPQIGACACLAQSAAHCRHLYAKAHHDQDG